VAQRRALAAAERAAEKARLVAKERACEAAAAAAEAEAAAAAAATMEGARRAAWREVEVVRGGERARAEAATEAAATRAAEAAEAAAAAAAVAAASMGHLNIRLAAGHLLSEEELEALRAAAMASSWEGVQERSPGSPAAAAAAAATALKQARASPVATTSGQQLTAAVAAPSASSSAAPSTCSSSTSSPASHAPLRLSWGSAARAALEMVARATEEAKPTSLAKQRAFSSRTLECLSSISSAKEAAASSVDVVEGGGYVDSLIGPLSIYTDELQRRLAELGSAASGSAADATHPEGRSEI
jgi:hypothetical protein